ncbi:MAG: NAD(P)H-dependent oxidoreductase subunit E, partial [Desulfobacterales bacterium]
MSPAVRPEHADIAPDMWPQIDEIITANRSIKGSVIAVLRQCQDVVGYLPVELMEYIASGMNLARSDVFGV